MSEDVELLRRYAREGSEAAFAALVTRHVDLVYSAALRLLNGDRHRAQDVTQLTFTELARQARKLATHPSLVGWLYTTSRRMALRVIRTESRRQRREQEAGVMNDLMGGSDAEPHWQAVRPVLEEVMHELTEADRGAILLRFFKNKTLTAVGSELGLSENAARMRIERALEKLRAHLARRGVHSTSAALVVLLSANAVSAAPPAFAAAVAAASLAGAAKASSLFGIIKIMSATKLKFGIAALAVAGITATLVSQKKSESTLRRENEALRQEVAQLAADAETLSNRLTRVKAAALPRLPAPAVHASASAATGDVPQQGGLYERLKQKRDMKLTGEQLRSYLEANRRNAASLLAGFRTTRDPQLLEEAKRNFPTDPQVAFEAALDPDATPADRRRWLEAFQKSDPSNAFPDYLRARDLFNAGQPDLALQELAAASNKGFQDYSLQRVQDDEEAYLAAGYSVAESKSIPSSQLRLPQLAMLKALGTDLTELANSYRQNGDSTSAQAVLDMAAALGQRYSQGTAGEAEVSQLVGMAIERNALSAMDPNAIYADGLTVKQRLDQLDEERSNLKTLNAQLEPLLAKLSEQDWIIYKDRWRNFGEEAAMRWIINKYGTN